ncbi:MAG: TAXI family TRAP transporter solute-binding subunit [Geminicoccaceae bacterium]|nr:TAXI family TRAP transporter solute-binding subunit [Geminicoccaceae bacterium]
MRKILVTALAAAGMATASVASAETLRLMTGPQGGVWVPLGGALKAIWEKALPGVTVQTMPGAGIANVRGVDEGKAEIGFGNTISTVDGYNGLAPFPKKTENVCNLATLYPQYFQIVVLADAGIRSVADLKGRSLAAQTRGNTAEVVTQHVLQVYGLSYNDLKVNFMASYTDAVSLMKDGHAQAFTLGTTIPSGAVMDLASARDIELLSLDDQKIAELRKLNPGYAAVTVPAGTYPKQTKDVQTVGYATHLIVSCKLPPEQVRKMLESMVANLGDLVAVNKAIQGLTPKAMAQDIGVPFHPGAIAFYKAQGVL